MVDSDTLLRHRRVHGNSTSTPAALVSNKVSNNDDNATSPSRIEDAAATLVDLQALADRQIYHQNAAHMSPLAQDLPRVYYGNANDRVDLPQVEPDRLDGQPQIMTEGINASSLTNDLLDPALQIYSQDAESNLFLSPHMEFRSTHSMQNDYFPLWHIGDDFDLEAFHTSLRSPLAIDQLSMQPIRTREDDSVSGMETQVSNSRPMEDIQSLWITKTDSYSWEHDRNPSYSIAPTRPVTPETQSSPISRVDGKYREDLSLRMRPRWKEDPLPSTDFMNLALQLFFTKVNPIFPILHGPTFRPGIHNSLLLLSICSIGSLFMGSSSATAQGAKIFERLNKVILASWENIVTKNTLERVSLVQASVIGQTFAYLSGNSKYLATVEAFHGTVVALARRCGMFNVAQTIPELGNVPPRELEQVWSSWARSEEMTRTGLSLYVHDAQFASTFHHDPTLRHISVKSFVACNDDLFAAPSAALWANLIRSSLPEPTKISEYMHSNQSEHSSSTPVLKELRCKSSRFSCYVILHGIGAAVQECNAANSMTPTNRRIYQDALTCWYHAYEEDRSSQNADPLCLIILYHEISMSTLVDFNELERAVGRDGSSEGSKAVRYAGALYSTVEAKRCVIHASLIHRHIGSMRVDWEPALHVPRSVFLAAIAWYCYIKFDQGDAAQPLSYEESLEIPEIEMFSINPLQYLFEASGFKMGKPRISEASTLCGLHDMLHRIGHWGISRRFARILGCLIHGEPDSHLIRPA